MYEWHTTFYAFGFHLVGGHFIMNLLQIRLVIELIFCDPVCFGCLSLVLLDNFGFV